MDKINNEINFNYIQIEYFDRKTNRSCAAFQAAAALIFFIFFVFVIYDYIANYESGIYIGKIILAFFAFVFFLAAFINFAETVKYTKILLKRNIWNIHDFSIAINKNEIKSRQILTNVLSAGFYLSENSYLKSSDSSDE